MIELNCKLIFMSTTFKQQTSGIELFDAVSMHNFDLKDIKHFESPQGMC